MRQNIPSPFVLSLAIALATFGLTGCGGAAANSGNANVEAADLDGAVEEASGSTKAGDLTDTQEQALCEAINAYLASNISDDEITRLHCALKGIMVASLAEAEGDAALMVCEETRAMCVSQGIDASERTFDFAKDCDVFTLSASCNATLDEVETCIREQTIALKLMSSFTCSPPDNVPDTLAAVDNSTACAAVEMKCPEVPGGWRWR